MLSGVRVAITLLSLSTLMAITACAPAGGPATPPKPSPTTAPATAVPTSGVFAGPGDHVRGKVVYDTYCLGCHPFGPQGTGPDIRGRSADIVEMKVRSGGGGMPVFPEAAVSNQQLNDVAAYVSSIQKQ